MRRSPKRTAFNIFAGSLLSILSNIATAELLVVIPEYTDEYTSVAQAIIDSAPGHGGQLLRYADLESDIDRYELVVSVGKEAVLSVNQDPRFTNIPVISAFAPRSTYQQNPYRTAVFSDVNPAIHLRLIQNMFPGRMPRIGIFVDNETKYLFQSESFNRIGRFVLIPKKITQGENPARIIESFVHENDLDAFIVLPSSIIYDPHSLTAMLYSLYQLNVAAIAYTPKLVEGGVGCVAAAYFDKELVVSEVGEKIESFYKTGALSEQATTPKKAKVIVNERLAKALQLDLSNLMKYGEIHEQ